MGKNNLKQVREDLMISGAELARKANVSSITIVRIEDEQTCTGMMRFSRSDRISAAR